MAIAVVASTQARFGATSASIDTTGATLLVVVNADFNFGALSTPTDSKSNTWTNRTTYGTGGAKVRISYVENPTVGSGHTFSCGGGSNGIAVIALSGTKTSSAYDVENGADGAQSGSVTPSEDNEILITGHCNASPATYSVDLSFTIQEQRAYNAGDNTMGFGLAYLIQTSAAAKNPTWSGGTPGATNIATFKAAAAAAGQPTMKRFGAVPFAAKVGGDAVGMNLWRKAGELLLPKRKRVIVPGFEFARGAV